MASILLFWNALFLFFIFSMIPSVLPMVIAAPWGGVYLGECPTSMVLLYTILFNFVLIFQHFKLEGWLGGSLSYHPPNQKGNPP
jgi:hypothetical protein